MGIRTRARDLKVSFLVPLCVVLWKHLKERQHRFLYTLWEIFGGLLVFLVVFLVNQTVKPLKDVQPRIVSVSSSLGFGFPD